MELAYKGVEAMHRTEIASLQNERFQSTWRHIAATPLYQRKMIGAGIDAGRVSSLSALGTLPITYKSDVRNTKVFERTPLSVRDIYAIYSSSGTSGAQTLYACTEQDVSVQTEVAQRMMTGVGLDASDMGLVLAPLGLPIMGHCMIRQFAAVGASFVPAGQANPDEVVSLLRSLPITAVATLPTIASRLHEYMRFLMHADVDEPVHVGRLLLGGDSLSRIRRRRLEQGWSAKCYDFYGLSEIFGPLAGECPRQSGLHFASDYVFVELLDPHTKEPVAEGAPGVAVYTTLWEKGFPLLRYWSDDYVTWTWEECACGRKSPRMDFLGRATDCVGHSDHILFPRDIEDTILEFPIGDEYNCEYALHHGKPVVVTNVESLEDTTFSVAELRDALESVFALPVQVNVTGSGTLPRGQAKPKRLVGFPQ